MTPPEIKAWIKDINAAALQDKEEQERTARRK
jgi:hypothetical protein